MWLMAVCILHYNWNIAVYTLKYNWITAICSGTCRYCETVTPVYFELHMQLLHFKLQLDYDYRVGHIPIIGSRAEASSTKFISNVYGVHVHTHL